MELFSLCACGHGLAVRDVEAAGRLRRQRGAGHLGGAALERRGRGQAALVLKAFSLKSTSQFDFIFI